MKTITKASSCAAVFALLLSLDAIAAEGADSQRLDLSLEDLMQVVVTSVSKKPQTLAHTAAAATVISADEIRRSGATSIPEALRLAPGVQVSALGHNKWAISIRGFADRFSNKLQVLVDGVSVYSPLFSGVLWEGLDIPLENIERIEVIRGPGASVWGANAVNGVINIITRSAFDTRGGVAAVAGGNVLNGRVFGRYGWTPDPDTAIRFHVKAHDVDPGRSATGGDGADDWRAGSAGLSVERLLENGTLRVDADVSRSRTGDEVLLSSAPPALNLVQTRDRIERNQLRARWDASGSDGRQQSLQFNLERSELEWLILGEKRTTVELEYQQRLAPALQHDLAWGVGYRFSRDQIDSSTLITVREPERDSRLYSVYLQDEVTLEPERWRVSLGARLDRNDYTGNAFQPNMRLLWTPTTDDSLWLALARAVRTPSRIERGGALYMLADPVGAPPFIPPSVVQLVSDNVSDEVVKAMDVGWRSQLSSRLSADVAGFYNRYDNLRGAAFGAPTVVAPGYLLIQTTDNNANTADVRGVELSTEWQVADSTQFQLNYSWLDARVKTAALPGQTQSDYADTSPTHQISLRASTKLLPGIEGDLWLRRISAIHNANFEIPAYTTLDLRLAWRVDPDVELALVGQNLLDSAHPEFGSTLIPSVPTEIRRAGYLSARMQF